MNPEDEIITQMGLILTQMKYARRAMEDIERTTSRYGGVNFAAALAGGRFGEPPMFNGALKVYVVNINDLTSGGTSPFEGLLGGIGRFVGGLVGGVVGGTVGGALLPVNLYLLGRITQHIHAIVDKLAILGFFESGGSSGGGGGGGFGALIPSLRATIQDLTALFHSAAEPGSGKAGAPATAGGQQWLSILLVGSALVDGLIILVPILSGALASFIVRIDQIKLAFNDMLQFVLRNTFLLRGVVLITIFDTVAAAANLAASLLTIAVGPMRTILTAVFDIVGTLLDVVVEAMRFIGHGLSVTINGLMTWLQDGFLPLLVAFGDTRVFRLIYHLVDILPAILPALLKLKDPSITLSPAETSALTAAAARPVPGPGGIVAAPGTAPRIAPFPDLTVGLPAAGALSTILMTAGTRVTGATNTMIEATAGMLTRMGATFSSTDLGGADIQRHIAALTPHADALAGALTTARDAAANAPRTGMEAIAQAYEGWLGGGGLNALLTRITDHFAQNPAILAAVAASAADARAVVTIEQMTIVVEPPSAPNPAHGPTSSLAPTSNGSFARAYRGYDPDAHLG